EGTISNTAMEMLQTGTPLTTNLVYPHVPLYFASAAMGAGYWVGKLTGQIHSTADLHNAQFPKYDPAIVFVPPRLLFAALSTIDLLLVAFIAYFLYPVRGVALLSALIFNLSTLHLYQSWRYLNVDTIATLMAVGALAATLYFAPREGLGWKRAVAPGLLC